MEMAHFYKIKDRVNQLRKLELSEDHDKYHAPDVYEWMKYKVASDIGGVEEREAFEMFERMQINERGATNYKLWRENIENDPQSRFIQQTF